MKILDAVTPGRQDRPQAPHSVAGIRAGGLLGWLAGALGLGRLRREQLALWDGALSDAGLAVLCISRAGLQASRLWHQRLGPPQGDWLDWLRHSHALDRQRLAPRLQGLLVAPSPFGAVLHERLRLSDGEGGWTWFELRAEVLERDARGLARLARCALSDARQRQAQRDREASARGLFRFSGQAQALLDGAWRIEQANPAFHRLCADWDGAMEGQRPAVLGPEVLATGGHEASALWSQLSDAARARPDEAGWEGAVWIQDRHGQLRSLLLRLHVIETGEEEEADALEQAPRRFMLEIDDRSAAEAREKLLLGLARQDPLTGLLNEAGLTERIAQAQARWRPDQGALCVARLDVDGFARINTELGEQGGDRVLQHLAHSLRSALRGASGPQDAIARLGGDEFGLLLHVSDEQEAHQALRRLLRHARGAVQDRPLSVSMGATLYPMDEAAAETLMRHAASALNQAKRDGRDRHAMFDPGDGQASEQRSHQLRDLEQALELGELMLYYQPKIALADGRVVGMEALLRWRHPLQGVLGPDRFLHHVESSPLAGRLGDWVLQQGLAQAGRWRDQGLALELSLNISARHLQSPGFVARLRELLAQPGAPAPQQLCLELLESSALPDLGLAESVLRECRALGLKLALDDFGTGYANLAYLRRLPFDALKLDRSFVQTLLVNEKDQALVRNALALARELGLATVAEGAESPAHLDALRALGCQQAQGNGIALPMPADQVSVWLNARAGRLPG